MVDLYGAHNETGKGLSSDLVRIDLAQLSIMVIAHS